MTCRIRLLVAFVLIFPWMGTCRLEADQRPPNVVVFLVDDMGIMDTSVPFLTDDERNPRRYPLNDFYRTPNLERLAERGIRFNNFYAMSVCSPTRIAIMTGQNAARHRTTNWIDPDQDNRGPQGPPAWNWRGLQPGNVTLASLLAEAGYRTIHVGKGHFAPRHQPGADPSQLGFAINLAGGSFGSPASYYGNDNFGNVGGPNERESPRAVPQLEKYHGTDTFLTEALTIEALELVTSAVKAQQPFFLHLSHYAVHGPFQADPRFIDNYEHSELPSPAKAFATLIEGMDKSLGDLLDHLEGLGVADNTLILFLGDNGSDAPLGHQHEVACAAPLRGKKGTHYEGGMRTPFIGAWAESQSQNPHQQSWSIPAGAIQSQIASVCDLLPTILELVELTPPADHVVDGHTLRTLLSGRPDPGRSESFLMHYPHAPHRSDYWSSYREGRWKVIYHYFPSAASEDSHYQLFDLKQDPFEQHNLAGHQPVQLDRMMHRLVAALEAHEALYPVEEDQSSHRRPQLP